MMAQRFSKLPWDHPKSSLRVSRGYPKVAYFVSRCSFNLFGKNINPVDSANTNCTTAGILKVRKSRRKFLQTTNDFFPDF